VGVLAVWDYHKDACYANQEKAFLTSISDLIALAVERKFSDEVMDRKDDIVRVFYSAIIKFFETREWKGGIKTVLADLGRALEVDQVLCLENEYQADGKIVVHLRYDILINKQLKRKNIPRRNLVKDVKHHPLFSSLSRGKSVWGAVDMIPGYEQLILKKLGALNLVAVPIFVAGKWWGSIIFIEYSFRRIWHPVEVRSIEVASKIFGALIKRRKILDEEMRQQQIAETMRKVGSIMSATLDYDGVIDILLEQVKKIISYDSATIVQVEGNIGRPYRSVGYDKYRTSDQHLFETMVFEIDKYYHLQKLVETGEPVIVKDAKTDPHWIPNPATAHVRSWMGIPIYAHGKLVALFSVDKTVPDYYHLEDAKKLTTLVGHAALALENARLFSEATEALVREQRINEVTNILTSNLELEVVLKNVVRLAVELVGADGGAISLLSPACDTLNTVYEYNLPGGMKHVQIQRGQGLAWRVIDSDESILVNDYAHYPEALPQNIKEGLVGVMGVSIKAGAQVNGVLEVFSFDVGKKFTERELSLIEMLGRQAAVAIQNARLFETAQRRAEEAESLRQATAALVSSLDLEQVLDTILIQLEKVIPYDTAAAFILGKNSLHIMAARGFSNIKEVLGQEFSDKDKLFNEIRKSGHPVIIQDAQKDPRFEGWCDTGDTRGWMGIPMIARSEIIGFIGINSLKVSAYSENEARLAQAYVNQAAVAIENARLFEYTQQLAITDSLTGIYNRRHLFELGKREFERAERYKRPLSAIMIDLDHFKRINDTYGHALGDKILQKLTGAWQKHIREIDILGRYGGEEFTILLPESDIYLAVQAAERLRLNSEKVWVSYIGQRVQVTISLGVAQWNPTCSNLDMLIEWADRALYAAKQGGRNRVMIWTGENTG
jgi:diguanylate cyclase (GGDEF)-like protein